MATNAVVSAQAMQQAQARFEQSLQTTQQIANEMQSQQAMLQGAYKGEASNQFSRAIDAWLERFGRVRTALESVHTQLQSNTQYYQRTDSDNLQSGSQLANAIAG